MMETEKPPPNPSANYRMRMKTGRDTENFQVCPVKMRNKLEVLLETPSLS